MSICLPCLAIFRVSYLGREGLGDSNRNELEISRLNAFRHEADLDSPRLKQAAADPSSLTQQKIIANLDGTEKERLSKLRNIGIAVGQPTYTSKKYKRLSLHRHISTAVKQQPPNESFSTPAESMRSTKSEVKMLSAQRWIPWSWNEKRELQFNLRRRSVTG